MRKVSNFKSDFSNPPPLQWKWNPSGGLQSIQNLTTNFFESIYCTNHEIWSGAMIDRVMKKQLISYLYIYFVVCCIQLTSKQLNFVWNFTCPRERFIQFLSKDENPQNFFFIKSATFFVFVIKCIQRENFHNAYRRWVRTPTIAE